MCKKPFHCAVPFLVALLVLGCNTANSPEITPAESVAIETPLSASALIQLARNAPAAQANDYLLSAIEILQAENDFQGAEQLLVDLANASGMNDSQRLRLTLATSRNAMAAGRYDQALQSLDGIPRSVIDLQMQSLQLDYYLLRAGILSQAGRRSDAIRELINANVLAGAASGQDLPDRLWQELASLNDNELATMAGRAETYEQRGWIELVRQVNRNQSSIRSQLDALESWRGVWTRHSAFTRPPNALSSLQAIWDQRPRHIALLLPLQDQVGRAVQEGFLSAYYEALQRDVEVPRLSLYDTAPLLSADTSQNIYGLYDTAVADGADLVIGPLDKGLVQQLQTMGQMPVTTLALNYTDNELRNSPNLFQFGLDPEDEIHQVVQLARNAGHENAAIITPAGEDYLRLQKAFSDHWQSSGGVVVSRASFGNDSDYPALIKHLLAIDASEARAARITGLLPRSDIEFTPRRRQDIDFIFLLANPRQARQIKPTLSFYFAGDIPVYSLSSVYDGSEAEGRLANQDLDGIIFTDSPWMLDSDDPLKTQITETLRSTQGPLQRLRALGIDAFRLYSRLQQLSTGMMPVFPGKTGTLSLTDYGAIRREVANAVFENGLPRVLSSEHSAP